MLIQQASLCLQSLSHCEQITDDGIQHLGGSLASAESLTVLELDNCPLITDASLEHLMGCQSLERIELYDCQLITRAGIRRLRVRRNIFIMRLPFTFCFITKCSFQNHLPDIKVHAYFAPVTPPPSVGGGRQRYCRCCVIL